MDPVEILHCIFLLGSLQFGQPYLVGGLTATQQTMLPDLRDFGLVYHKVDLVVLYLYRMEQKTSTQLGWQRN